MSYMIINGPSNYIGVLIIIIISIYLIINTTTNEKAFPLQNNRKTMGITK